MSGRDQALRCSVGQDRSPASLLAAQAQYACVDNMHFILDKWLARPVVPKSITQDG